MTMTQEKTWNERAQEIANNGLGYICELYAAYSDLEDGSREDVEIDSVTYTDADEIRDLAAESALSVEVRSGWHSPGSDYELDEFRIVLSTGGPATQIIGKLDGYQQPADADFQVQDWFKPWTTSTLSADHEHEDYEHDALMWFVSCFYFGG